jgi:L-asparagine transporter-like permease
MPPPNTNLKRGLKERHIQLIALGGSIGVGLFLGSASGIRMAGPSIILAYLLSGILVFFLLRALGELAVAYPVAGSFSAYAGIFFGPFAGYITGWTYWFMWIIIGIAEITAIGVYMTFWLPDLPQWIPALATVFVIASVNMITVEAYGEFEFWLSLIKAATIAGFIAIGLGVIFLGIGNGGVPVGTDNLWQHGGFFPNGLQGMIYALPMIIFAYMGAEIIGVTAGEAKEPEKVLPKAINSFFLRIILFYVGSMYVILSLYPWNEIGEIGSPFVGVLEKTGVRYAAAFMNFVVLSAAASAFNSGIFSAARMLHSMAKNKTAPAFLGKVNTFSAPLNAVLFSSGFLLAGVFLNYFMPAKIFIYATSLSAFAGLFIWGMVFFSQLKFRQTLSRSQILSLKYPMPFYPFSGIFAIFSLFFILIAISLNPDTRPAVIIGPLWLVFLTLSYYFLGYQK